jgi:hypothetical protein
MSPSLSEIVLPNPDRDDLAARMDGFYAAVDLAVARNEPVCRQRGECCHFATYGHKLYVSSVELVFFVRHARLAWRPPGESAVCPYQIDGLCAARPFRPLGCRIFFCDPDSQDWQGPEYELRLMELRQIGVDFGVDYRYEEWLSALRDLTRAAHSKKGGFAGIDAPSADMIEYKPA